MNTGTATAIYYVYVEYQKLFPKRFYFDSAMPIRRGKRGFGVDPDGERFLQELA